MKKALVLISILSLFITAVGCKKSETSKKSDALATKYAKFRISVYKDNSMDKKAWLAFLEKGEPVELINEETVKIGKNDIKISKVKLSDDAIAFIQSDYLAVKPVVFIEKNVKVYNRNNINSGEYHVVPAGTVAFVTDEKADWLQIDAGKIGAKYVTGKWVKGGVSDSAELVADAVSLEKVRGVLTEAVQGSKEEALTLLKTLAEKNNAIGALAKDDLIKIEGGATEEKKSEETPPPAAG